MPFRRPVRGSAAKRRRSLPRCVDALAARSTARAADQRAASAANSAFPNAVPAIPRPPSTPSVGNAQVRRTCDGSPAIRATICVTSATSAFCQGAVVLSRAEQSLEPFDLVATQMQDEAKRLLADRVRVRPRTTQ